MTKRIAYFEYGRVYPQPEDAVPLIDDVYVPPEPEPVDDPPTRLRLCALLALLWYIAFAAISGAAYIYVLRYPLEPADHVWQAIPIGVAVALLLWGITLTVRRCARRENV